MALTENSETAASVSNLGDRAVQDTETVFVWSVVLSRELIFYHFLF